jgi:hypothetical protein
VSSGYENIDVSKHLSWPEIQQADPDGQLKQQVTRLQVPSNNFLKKKKTKHPLMQTFWVPATEHTPS